jgi:hypothetical protein
MIYDAPVVAWAVVGPDVRPTGKTEHRVNGRLIGPAAGLAICRATASDGGYYLFYCDSDWEEEADTWHETLAGAKAQAEFEYEGVDGHWRSTAQGHTTGDECSARLFTMEQRHHPLDPEGERALHPWSQRFRLA